MLLLLARQRWLLNKCNILFVIIILIDNIVISREVNKGIAIENLHYLNDGLWNFKIPKVPAKSEDK